jgi:(2Fe-2S) ferredoxin
MPRLLYVCEGGDCTERGSGDLHDKIKEQMASFDPNEERVKVRRYPCFGGCEAGINVTLFPDRVFYSHVKEDDVPEIVEHVLGEGKPVDRLTGHVQQDVEEIIWEMLDSPY